MSVTLETPVAINPVSRLFGHSRGQSATVWRAMRVTPLAEFYQWGRVGSALFMLVARASLTYWLWRSLYKGTASSAGMNVNAATTYAMLGVFYQSFRVVNRWAARDTMVQHMLEGTIVYWFLRPVSPRRFYCVRVTGDLLYGGCWAAVAFSVTLGCGLIQPPASLAAGLAACATLALGLVILYYLQQLIDLACFWTVVNYQLVIVFGILQNVLAGALVPLWFFPSWFISIDQWLPFQSTLNVPLSLYIGRLPVSSLGQNLAVQALWIAALATILTFVWRRAAARVTVMGG